MVERFTPSVGEGTLLNWFDSIMKWKLGNATNIRFWGDMWVREETLKDRFLRLYLISLCKESNVGELGE